MKIFTIIGARPQIIKSGIISKEIAKRNNLEEVLLHTGQHFDDNMSDIFFREMAIQPPKYNLGLDSLSHGAMIGRMLEQIEIKLKEEKPDVVLLIGDTNSTLAGAIAARKLDLFIAHVESGIRSYNKLIPEETNRLISDHVSDIQFCSNEAAVHNLAKEGMGENVYFSGDVMKDAALFFAKKAKKPTFPIKSDFILATCHRAENTDDKAKLAAIFKAFESINETTQVVLPLHPRTKKKLEAYNIKTTIKIIEPVGYLEMLWLLNHCKMVITDSGGLPKEAFFFNKPSVTLRPEIEWIELAENSCTKLLSHTSVDSILEAYEEMIVKEIPTTFNFYGDGNARKIIIDKILELV